LKAGDGIRLEIVCAADRLFVGHNPACVHKSAYNMGIQIKRQRATLGPVAACVPKLNQTQLEFDGPFRLDFQFQLQWD